MEGSENWLAACRIKDQLQSEGSYNRIYNAVFASSNRSGQIRKESQFCCINQVGLPREMQGLHICRSRLTQRTVLGMCAIGKAWGSLRSAACALRVVGMCALENA